MDKRQFIKRGLQSMVVGVLGTLTGLKSTFSFAAYPVAAFRAQSVDDILVELFETSDAGEDGSINIQVPLEAEHQAYIPFRISATGAEKIAVLVDNNPEPLVLSMVPGKNTDGVVIGTLQVQSSSTISCYAFKQGQLYLATRRVRLAESGYEN
jgi:predicted secreted protein